MKAAFAISKEQLMTVAYGEGWTMKAAFSTHDKRIAPVFDVAQRVHLVTTGPDRENRVEELELPEILANGKVQFLAEQGVDLLVCGAISRPLEELVLSHRIQIIPFVSGQLDQVITAWRNGELDETQFAMPGCCGRRQRRRHRRGRNR